MGTASTTRRLALALQALFLWPLLARAQSEPVPPPAQPTPIPTPPDAEPSDDVKLANGIALYDAGKPQLCVAAFRELLDRNDPQRLKDARLVEQARVYYSACLIEIGRTGEAEKEIEKAIRANPLMKPPDAVVFQKVVVDTFQRVRDTLLDAIQRAEQERIAKAQALAAARERREVAERQRVQRLEELASTEHVVRRNRRWIAAVPFGVGQLQNGQDGLGYVLLGTEVALAGVALGAMIVQLDLHAQADEARRDDSREVATDELNAKLATAYATQVVASWGFLVVAAGGIVHAQLTFVPEFRDDRRRPLPKHLQAPKSAARLFPVAAASQKGGWAGVGGSF
jgi:tetratricopeptide (TPR) repeat protein